MKRRRTTIEGIDNSNGTTESQQRRFVQGSINVVVAASHRLVLERYHLPEPRRMITVPGGRRPPNFNTPDPSSDEFSRFAQRYQHRTQLQQHLFLDVEKSDGYLSLMTRAPRSSYSLPHVSHDQPSILHDQTIIDLLDSTLSPFTLADDENVFFSNQILANSQESAFWFSEMKSAYAEELASSALSKIEPNTTGLQSQELTSSLSEMEFDKTAPDSQELSSSLSETAQDQTPTPSRGPASLFSGIEFDQTPTRVQDSASSISEMADSLADDLPATQLQAFTSSPPQVPITPKYRTSIASIQGTAKPYSEVPPGQNPVESKALASSPSLPQMPITPNDRNSIAPTGRPANAQLYAPFDPNPPHSSSEFSGKGDIWNLLGPIRGLSGQAPANVQLHVPSGQSSTSQGSVPLFRSVPIEFQGRLLSQGSSPAEPPPPQHTTFPRPWFFQYPINARLYNAFIAQKTAATLPRWPEPELYDFEALALRINEKLKKDREELAAAVERGRIEYDEAYERNLHEMEHGPNCACNSGWPINTPENNHIKTIYGSIPPLFPGLENHGK